MSGLVQAQEGDTPGGNAPSSDNPEASEMAEAKLEDDNADFSIEQEPESLEMTVVTETEPPPTSAPVSSTPIPPAAIPPQTPEPIIIDDEVDEVSYGEMESSTALFGQLSLIETPFSVGIIDQEIILERRAFTAVEALLYEASVTRPMGGGFYNRADFSVRGFAPDTFQSYRSDGLPLINVVEPPIDDKERIEILKGPAGLRFGFTPPGGAINYIRKRPTPSLYRSISTDIDTFGNVYSQMDFGDTLSLRDQPEGKSVIQNGGTLGYRVVIAGDDFDDFYDNAGGDRVFGSAFLEWKPNEDISVWTSVSGQNRERHGYGGVVVSNSGEVFDTGVTTNTMQDWGHNRQEVVDFATGVDFQLNDTWLLRTSTSYGESARSGYQSWPGFVFDNGSYNENEWLIGTQSWDYWAHHSHLEGEFHTGPIKHDLVVGGEYRFVEAARSPLPRGSALIGVQDAFNLMDFWWVGVDPVGSERFYEYSESSFFATDIVELTDWLSFLGGVRYSELQTVTLDQFTGAVTDFYNEPVVSPTAAIMLEPVEDFHTYASYTEGMVMGGTAPANTINALEQMPPIGSKQIEAGIKSELFEDRVYGEIAFFKIEQDLEYIDSSRLYVQDGLQVHKGVEFLLRGQISDNINAGISAMVLDAVQEETGDPTLDGKKPENVPDFKTTAWVDWDIPAVEGLSLSLNTIVVGSRFADSTEQFPIDQYCILNAGARYRFETQAGDQWTLRAYVENVTDERYFHVGSFLPAYGGQLDYGAPVHATFSVQVEF